MAKEYFVISKDFVAYGGKRSDQYVLHVDGKLGKKFQGDK